MSVLITMIAAAPLPARDAKPSIAWRSFDTAAFKEAKDQGKLVLLSIQAPWGHWDRLMSEITFADPNVVALTNDKFIPVKVDALLRPDIWARYGMGGWPTTTFLLHTGQPVYFPDASRKLLRSGGTYYATEPMLSYLDDLAKYYAADRAGVERAADEIAREVLARKEVKSAPLASEQTEVAVTKILQAYGDWNPDPDLKAYRTPDLDGAELAFAYWLKKGDRSVLDAALHRLTDMARGGIHDQLGGGFHRIAADAAWRVPAFEKMLQVNAEMLQAYTDAYMVTGAPRYREIAEETAAWVLGALAEPDGWFAAYMAADAALGEDGDYYTWTLDEAKSVLSDEERTILVPAYDIGEWGEMVSSAPRRNVLFLSEGPQLLAERLKMDKAKVTAIFESGRHKLLEARSKRTAPPVGHVLIADANADMAASLIMAGDFLRKPDLAQAGLKDLDFLWSNALDPNTGLMDHAWVPGKGRSGAAALFGDQVSAARALVAAYESTGRTIYLDRAGQLARAADAAFADALDGGWMDRLFEPDAPGFLSWPTRSIRDNSRFAEVLLKLRILNGRPGDDPLVKTARKALESWADEFANYRDASAPFGLAVDHALSDPLEVIVVSGGKGGGAPDGGADGAGVESLARSMYAPWRIVRHVSGGGPDAAPAAPAGSAAPSPAPSPEPWGLKEMAARQLKPPAGASCYFCQGARCAGPFVQGDKLRAKLDEFLGIHHAAAPKPAAAETEGGPDAPKEVPR